MQGPLEQLMCSLPYVLQRKSNNQSCEQNGALTEVMLCKLFSRTHLSSAHKPPSSCT